MIAILAATLAGFAVIFLVAVTVQIRAPKFHPVIYWVTIIATTTADIYLAAYDARREVEKFGRIQDWETMVKEADAAFGRENYAAALETYTKARDINSVQKIEDLMAEIKDTVTIVIVTHNMQQAARVSDFTAFFLQEVAGEPAVLVEYGRTSEVFTSPTQFGPTRRMFSFSIWARTRTISCTGIPSVIQKMRGICAPAASRIASAVCLAGIVSFGDKTKPAHGKPQRRL